MRVISGYLKSRPIVVLKSSKNIRPTTDRARETLFNIVSNSFEFNSSNILDLFAGSGSFGIECLSRGSGFCCFVDSVTDSIMNNVKKLNLGEQSKIVKSDVLYYLKNNSSLKFDLIFADPPYDYQNYEKLLDFVSVFNSFFILEHSQKNSNIGRYEEYIINKKDIGISSFIFYNFEKNEKQ